MGNEPLTSATVSPTSRRIFLYWLLLLVPTLVVGGGAIYLLRREQARLAQRSELAEEARRAAIAARARLVVENVELLVGDVQTGLLDALAEVPAGDVVSFMAEWEASNPLVRTGFLAEAEGGRVLWPDASTSGEDARGFLRRFRAAFGAQPPWLHASDAYAAPAAATSEPKQVQAAEVDERGAVSSNVAQVQSARRDVQELLKARTYPSAAAPSAGAGAYAEAEQTRAERTAELADRVSGEERKLTRARDSAPLAKTQRAAAKKETTPDRRGWTPVELDGRLHLLGWLQPGGAARVRGVELELVALISRLAGALPAEVGEGEGYALRDNQGRVLHQAGEVRAGVAPAVRVPLAAGLLPGWEVLGYWNVPYTRSGGDGLLLWTGGGLVAIFVAAILAGGSLLLRQARRSELEAAQKTSFVANVSHEFKTPLTTIRLYSELLEQGRVRDAAQGGEYLRTIGRETQRLARLVNNALDFSRLEQGRKKYAREPVDLAAELARLLDTQAPRLAEAGLALTRELPGAALTVTTDRDAFEQIVLNLLDNACKYAAGGGELKVALRTRGAGAEVRVSDRGPGVPAEHRERVFEKFHRVDEALTAEKTGAGLGLSIARQLARGLGGELRCVPREGGGAEFVLDLP